MTLGITNSYSCFFKHVYVTVNDIRGRMTIGGAAPDQVSATLTDGSLIDLTPGIPPTQVDLLTAPGAPGDGCFIAPPLANAPVGNGGIPLGSYDEFQLVLDQNGSVSAPANNACSRSECKLGPKVYNCVVDDTNSCYELDLSSEAATGIPIPAAVTLTRSHMTLAIDVNAGLAVAPSQFTANHYDFKPNASNVQAFVEGTKPEVSGKVVASRLSGITVTPGNAAVPSANIWLEQEAPAAIPIQGGGSNLIEQPVRTTMSGMSASDVGTFHICPVPNGTYDLVADVEALPDVHPFNGSPSNATVATDIDVSDLSNATGLVIPLVPQTANHSRPVTAEGVVHTHNTTTTGDDVTLFAEQPFINAAGDAVQALIPFFSAVSGPPLTNPDPLVTTTTPNGTHPVPFFGDCSPKGCGGDPNCACYVFVGPNGNPIVGAANASGEGYKLSVGDAAVTYGIDARANIRDSATPICSPDQQDTVPFIIDQTHSTTGIPVLLFDNCD